VPSKKEFPTYVVVGEEFWSYDIHISIEAIALRQSIDGSLCDILDADEPHTAVLGRGVEQPKVLDSVAVKCHKVFYRSSIVKVSFEPLRLHL